MQHVNPNFYTRGLDWLEYKFLVDVIFVSNFRSFPIHDAKEKWLWASLHLTQYFSTNFKKYQFYLTLNWVCNCLDTNELFVHPGTFIIAVFLRKKCHVLVARVSLPVSGLFDWSVLKCGIPKSEWFLHW